MTTTEIIAGGSVEVIIFGIACLVVYRLLGKVVNLPKRLRVAPFQKGVFLAGAEIKRVVDAGTWWVPPKQMLVQVDMRPKPFQLQSRHFKAADGAPLQIAFGGEIRVVDAAEMLVSSTDSFGSLLLEIGKSTADAVAEFDGVAICEGKSLLVQRVQELVEPRAATLGMVVTNLFATEVIAL